MNQPRILLKQFCIEEAEREGRSASHIFVRIKRGEYPGLKQTKESPRKIWIGGDRRREGK